MNRIIIRINNGCIEAVASSPVSVHVLNSDIARIGESKHYECPVQIVSASAIEKEIADAIEADAEMELQAQLQQEVG